MYTLYDTFNEKVLSRHYTLKKAVEERCSINRRIRKIHGSGSYLPIRILDHDGDPIVSDHEEYEELWTLEGSM